MGSSASSNTQVGLGCDTPGKLTPFQIYAGLMPTVTRSVQSSKGIYTAVYEQAESGGWSGHTPDLPVILAVGRTLEETEAQMRSAVEVWLDEMDAASSEVQRHV